MKKTIKIKGMTCKSCEMLIKEEVEELDGVKSCHVSAEKGEATIEFDPQKTSFDKIKDIIKEEGYKIQ